jgi:prolipoprotein diacylglyceryl transferase
VELAYIPSPASGVAHIGPLAVHAYGVCIALGVLAAVWLSNRRWSEKGGSADDITTLATWGVPCGIIGARLYHVVTDFEIYRHDPVRMFAIWDGGLGIWGGIAGGVAAGAWVARRRGLPILVLMDVVAPALVLAQAIGRWGNYFNQELFGRPSTLPWALKIAPDHRPAQFLRFNTFHPTFLYESIWDLLTCATLLVVGRRLSLRPGRLFLLYVSLYTFGRFFIERLRVDYAHTFFGLRLNDWTSIVVFAVSTGLLCAQGLRDSPREPTLDSKTGSGTTEQ